MGLGDKLNNKAEEASGAAKEGLGKATGDKEAQAEGTGEKLQAKAKDAANDAKDSVKGFADGLKKDN
ncbi:CsbD family protein [Nesterenkonia cremea]|uniref:General stress protein CsbD n=1 Tax=Nesterenkonia cremea TaxID=1882340 RepID=A0A917AKM9_9MICC|nr:CsbD family protein [Nesterenkonia cremea]GGE58588.1 general stress protein CsbD [Nesterenkonia cremea]